MAFEHSMELKNEQKLQQNLNTRQLQSLEVLQLPLQELSSFLLQQLYENPMLELGDLSVPQDAEIFEPRLAPGALPEERPDDAPLEITSPCWDWGRVFTGEMAFIEALAGEQTFHDMLKEQICTRPLPPYFARLCMYLVGCLDRRGYLDVEPEVVAEELSLDVADVMQGLYLIQDLDPAGVGARNLQECLILQLARGTDFNSHTLRIVSAGLQLLARQDQEGLQRLLECSPAQARQAADCVRKLNPIPSRGYFSGDVDFTVVPDASVTVDSQGALHIMVNHHFLPRLELNHNYSQLLDKLEEDPARKYLQDRAKQAKDLIKALEDREHTLVRILRYIGEEQKEFLQTGTGIKPMSMSEVARALDLHLSTVSRGVKEKYIICTVGTIALKTLFTTGVGGAQGEVVSSRMARQALRRCVEMEDKKSPLSDEDLRLALQALGVCISRRTVAKYREELQIAKASQRKSRA